MAQRSRRAPKKLLMKNTWYPQPHDSRGAISFELDNATLDSTIIPFCFYDEGMGDPTARETNPRNAAFAVVISECNCFVNSRINQMFAEFRFSMSTFALDDNIPAIRFAYMPIYMAFQENYTAIDELSQLEIQDILELQTETSDRQGGPLYVAATDILEKASGTGNQGANTPFLDTDVGVESVAFVPAAYYNMLHHQTNGALLAASSGGLRWDTLTQNRPYIRKRFSIAPKVKRMNEFTYCGLLLHFPLAGTTDQLMTVAEVTAAKAMVHVDYNIRFNEWNEDFNSRML